MASLNKVTLIGNLGADPEVRYLDGGSVVTSFNVATNERYTNRSGEVVDQTEWFRVELWNELAKVGEKYLKKGNPVYIEGRLRTETYTDREGKERFALKVRANTMQLLGSPGDRAEGGAEMPAPRQQSAPAPQQATPAPQQSAPAPKAPAPKQPAARQPEAVPAQYDNSSADDDLPF